MDEESARRRSSGRSTHSRRRRSSLLDIGGPNSINRFASSISRSTQFRKLGTSINSTLDNLDDEECAIISPTSSPPSTVFESSDEELPLLETGTIKSTVPQTVFNAINTLIGMGILSLPLAFRLAGWIPGLILMTVCPLCTAYTAILLGKILDGNPSLMTYSDIGRHHFRHAMFVALLVTFAIDLSGAATSMVILFADTLHTIIPDSSNVTWKLLICVVTCVCSFFPLAVLSFLSFMGIIGTSMIVALVFIAGIVKGDSPGSLIHPAHTNLWPASVWDLLVSIGIFMAPWGGHVVFPELKRDMRHPKKYEHAVKITFSFAFSIDAVMAIIGFIMFGTDVFDEVTRNILTTPGYPEWLRHMVVFAMAALPVCKLPLLTRPLVSLADGGGNQSPTFLRKVGDRLLVCGIFFVISVSVKSFGQVMALLGSAICISTCISAPLVFYLLAFRDELSRTKVKLLIGEVASSLVIAVLSTAASIFA